MNKFKIGDKVHANIKKYETLCPMLGVIHEIQNYPWYLINILNIENETLLEKFMSYHEDELLHANSDKIHERLGIK